MSKPKRFTSYEERFPVESDHLSGHEPFLQIERLQPGSDEEFRLHCAGSIFPQILQQYGSEFSITDVALRIDTPDVFVDFAELLQPAMVKRLYLYCPETPETRVPQLQLANIDHLVGVEKLVLNNMLGLCNLTTAFPRLKIARLHATEQPYPLWRTLTELQLIAFRGELQMLGTFPHLKKLLLENAQLKSLDQIGAVAPALETLLIRHHRKALDVAGLMELSSLVNLELDIGKASTGLNDIRLPFLQSARMKHLPSAEFVENNRSLTWFKTKSYGSIEPPRNIGADWIKKYGEFGFGGFHVPDALR